MTAAPRPVRTMIPSFMSAAAASTAEVRNSSSNPSGLTACETSTRRAGAAAGGKVSCRKTISAPSFSAASRDGSSAMSTGWAVKTAGGGAGVSTAAARRASAVRRMPPGRRRASSSRSCGRPEARASASSALRGAGPRRSSISASASWDTLCRLAAEADAASPSRAMGVISVGLSPAARQSVPNAVSGDMRPSDSAAVRISSRLWSGISGSFANHSRRA